MSSRACSGALACGTGMAQSWGLHTLRGNIILEPLCTHMHSHMFACITITYTCMPTSQCLLHGKTTCCIFNSPSRPTWLIYAPSQRSLHNAPIFRLLLKVAVNGTHQCDFQNFWGPFGAQPMLRRRRRYGTQRAKRAQQQCRNSNHTLQSCAQITFHSVQINDNRFQVALQLQLV